MTSFVMIINLAMLLFDVVLICLWLFSFVCCLLDFWLLIACCYGGLIWYSCNSVVIDLFGFVWIGRGVCVYSLLFVCLLIVVCVVGLFDSVYFIVCVC